MRTVRQFFEWIIEWYWPDAPARNPVIAGDIPKKPEPLPKFPDDRVAARVMAAARAAADPRDRLVVELLARTGMRAGELAGLELARSCRSALARPENPEDGAFAAEACTGWRYVTEELQRAAVEAHLAEPADTAAARGRKKRAKTDRADARLLRDLLVQDRLPECWIPPGHILECRALLECYHDLRAEHTAWARAVTAITAIDVTVRTPPLSAGRPRRYTPARPRPPQPPTRRELITPIITSQPPRDWSGHELALLLHVKPRNMLTRLGEWAKLGFFTRTGFGTYALNTPPGPAPSTTAPDP